MTFSCTITTGEPVGAMRRLFATELERTHPRSTTTLVGKSGKAAFKIVAKDVAALRAAFNSVTSVLAVHAQVTRDL